MTESKNNRGVITAERKESSSGESPGPTGAFHRVVFYGALLGSLAGGLALAIFAYLVSTGRIIIVGLDMFATSGPTPATFVGAGIGIALGGLAGGLLTIFKNRPPDRRRG